MHPDSSAAPPIPRDGDVDETPLGKELPERGGADVTQNRLGTAGENRRHPLTLLAQSPVPDGVNTAMDAVEVGPFDPAVYSAR